MEEIRIMLADDHEVVLDSLAMMISSLPGIQVVATVADGQAALDRLQHQPVDIVLSDMHMPGMNGVELALSLIHISPRKLTRRASPDRPSG